MKVKGKQVNTDRDVNRNNSTCASYFCLRGRIAAKKILLVLKKRKCSMWGLNPRSSRLKRLWYSQVQKSELAYKHDAITSQLMERKIWQLRQTPNSWYKSSGMKKYCFQFYPLRGMAFQGGYDGKSSRATLFVLSESTCVILSKIFTFSLSKKPLQSVQLH